MYARRARMHAAIYIPEFHSTAYRSISGAGEPVLNRAASMHARVQQNVHSYGGSGKGACKAFTAYAIMSRTGRGSLCLVR